MKTKRPKEWDLETTHSGNEVDSGSPFLFWCLLRERCNTDINSLVIRSYEIDLCKLNPT